MSILILVILLICLLYILNIKIYNIVLISIPAPGHFLPLLGIAEKLVIDNIKAENKKWRYNITLINYNQLFKLTTFLSTYNNINYISLGDDIFNTSNIFKNASLTNSMMESTFILEDWLHNLYTPMYKSLKNVFKYNKFDLVIADIVTRAAIDIADEYNIECIINNADLLHILGSEIITRYEWIPPMLSGLSLNKIDFTFRLFYPIIYITELILYPLFINPRYNKLRGDNNLPYRSMVNLYANKVILQISTPGIDYARPIPPNIFYIGLTTPLLKGTINSDSQFVHNWIDYSNKSIIYLNLGTVVELPIETTFTIIVAMKLIIEKGDSKFLWKLKSSSLKSIRSTYNLKLVQEDSNCYFIDNLLTLKNDFLICSWLPNHVEILSKMSLITPHLQNTSNSIFISHCGINSVHEALLIGVPILCIPQFCDQLDMGQRLIDHNLGQVMLKTNVSIESLQFAINSLKSQSQVPFLRSAQNKLIEAGGASRAADIIEFVLLHGTCLIVPKSLQSLQNENWTDYCIKIMFSKEFLFINLIIIWKLTPFLFFNKIIT